jgi:uncharacterized protein with PQ loop repeat
MQMILESCFCFSFGFLLQMRRVLLSVFTSRLFPLIFIFLSSSFLFFSALLSHIVSYFHKNCRRKNVKLILSFIVNLFYWLLIIWEKVRTTKIRTSKFKKNVKNVSKHQNIKSVHLNFQNVKYYIILG